MDARRSEEPGLCQPAVIACIATAATYAPPSRNSDPRPAKAAESLGSETLRYPASRMYEGAAFLPAALVCPPNPCVFLHRALAKATLCRNRSHGGTWQLHFRVYGRIDRATADHSLDCVDGCHYF